MKTRRKQMMIKIRKKMRMTRTREDVGPRQE
jgi:hypothetical protein